MSKNLPTYDLFESRAARDEAIALVTDHNLRWIDRAFAAAVEAIPRGWIGTGEDVRRMVDVVVQPPEHHNAWGALIRKLAKRGVVVKTGVYVNMTRVSSHARTAPQYARNG